jgi:hypothetical protein
MTTLRSRRSIYFFVLAATAIGAIAAPTARAADRWEYLQLRIDEKIGKADTVNKILIPRVLLFAGGAVVVGDDWKGLGDKINAPNIGKDDAEYHDVLKNTRESIAVLNQRMRVFNTLGERGWELITHEREPEGEVTIWTFKRRMGN